MNLAFLSSGAVRGVDDENDVVSSLRTLKPELVAAVSALLRTSSSAKIRNEAALLLTDLVGLAATDAIIHALRRPGIAKSAGTLLYALNSVGAQLPLSLIIDLVEQGSLEAQAEALTFIADARVHRFSTEERDQALERLEAMRARGDGAADIALLGIEYLSDVGPTPDRP